ncbi:lysine exporter LysO family protein [Intestinibacillus massiliensis]|uniref:lysine exporter LysO family protein n=1 Tax=Intestinibacillus massiliensis TaxID=1871029 RepID=UPI000B34DFA2|nr:lysine exporter LysO family protein [Intestinibacillus massiliensis]MCB6365363.1 lysine exporter LysO family protein [Intestinibacillus massiliensis]
MIIAAIAALILGILCGALLLPAGASESVSAASDLLLYALMFSVGISVGANKLMLRKIKQYNIRVVAIPIGVTIGSLLGGFACAPILGHSLQTGAAIAGGMGWYSLSGIMVTELLGAPAGTVAFLSSLLREVLAFCLIPLLMRRTNAFAAIALAGATSEDTTLPVLIRYGGEDVALIAVINGMLCSAFVPVLINLVCKIG